MKQSPKTKLQLMHFLKDIEKFLKDIEEYCKIALSPTLRQKYYMHIESAEEWKNVVEAIREIALDALEGFSWSHKDEDNADLF